MFLCFKVLKNEPGNLFFSPLSLQLVLALAYSGAKSTTAEEIAKALLLPEKLDDVLEGYSLLLRFLDVSKIEYLITILCRKLIISPYNMLLMFNKKCKYNQ